MIAGPYRSGGSSREANLRDLNDAAVEVFRRGHLPVVGVNLALPMIERAGERNYDEFMMPVSLELASRCDAVLRIGGPSIGADREVERIRTNGGRVYASVADIPDLADGQP